MRASSNPRGNGAREYSRFHEWRKLPFMKRRTLFTAGAGVLTLAPLAAVSAARQGKASPDRRQALYDLMGRLPPRDRKVGARVVSTEDRGTYVLETLILDLNGEEAAPAFFAK